MSGISKSDAVQRAERAKILLEDPVLAEAFAGIEANTIEELLLLPPEADDKRRHLADRVNTIRAVREVLRHYVMRGEMISAERPRRTA